ncbi:MAG: hypothetical protein ACK5OX_03555 [Desertimonas sp.]
MVTTGALGGIWRAEVTPWGALVPADGSATLDWAIAADDRWHRPSAERAVRQECVQGTPVVETRVSIPGGDAIQRIWSVADGAGLTLMEVRNESPLPIALAVTRPDVLTNRPPADVPIEGIEMPVGSTMLPIGHRTSVVVGLAHDGSGPAPLPAGVAQPEAVVRGWRSLVERAGRLVLPDERAVEAVIATRCELLLGGVTDPADDPVAFLIELGDLQRLGELSPIQVDDVAVDVAAAIEEIARRPGWDVDAALDAAGRVFVHGDDRRAARDVAAVIDRRGHPTVPGWDQPRPDGARGVACVERRLAARHELLPAGLPASWRGTSIEAHGLPVGQSTTLSYALRWHGEHVAVLWETAGDGEVLRSPSVAPSWSSAQGAGETLWVDPTVWTSSVMTAPVTGTGGFT